MTSDVRTADRVPGEGRRVLGLALLVVAVLMIAVDMTVLFLAISRIAADLGAGGTGQLWVLHAGELVGAGLVLTAGRLVDRFGARRLLALSLTAYAGASLLASLAASVEMLIAARVLLGAATVSVTPAAMVLARRMFPSERGFAVAVSILMAAFSAGMALGPLLGGLLLDRFWWGAVFLVNVPVALLVLAGSPVLPSGTGSGRGRVDLPSVLLSLGGLAGVVYGGQELAAGGLAGLRGLVSVAVVVAGLLALVAFVRRQRRLEDPLLDLGLFGSAPFCLALGVIGLVVVADVGAEVQLAQHLQLVTGLDPVRAGIVLAVPAIVSVLTTTLAPALVRWWSSAAVIAGGAVLATGGAVLMAVLVARPDRAAVWVTLAAVLVAAGMAPAFGLGSALVVQSAPTEQTGSASAVQDTSGSLGNTLGLALAGSVALLAYSSAFDAAEPGGLRADELARSRESAAAAVSIAGERSGQPGIGEGLRVAAVESFAVATSVTYALAAAGFALAVVVALLLRRATARLEV